MEGLLEGALVGAREALAEGFDVFRVAADAVVPALLAILGEGTYLEEIPSVNTQNRPYVIS